MAFTVTPTSGAGPYVLSADIENSQNIDGLNFSAFLGSSNGVGFCQARGNTAFPSNLLDLLVSGQTVTVPTEVDEGNCRTFTLEIIRLSDNDVISFANALVDNV